ncbi:uncharacterized protein B0T23DRAFT_356746, partial [Neurospora hispaniola]
EIRPIFQGPHSTGCKTRLKSNDYFNRFHATFLPSSSPTPAAFTYLYNPQNLPSHIKLKSLASSSCNWESAQPHIVTAAQVRERVREVSRYFPPTWKNWNHVERPFHDRPRSLVPRGRLIDSRFASSRGTRKTKKKTNCNLHHGTGDIYGTLLLHLLCSHTSYSSCHFINYINIPRPRPSLVHLISLLYSNHSSPYRLSHAATGLNIFLFIDSS